MMMKAKGLDCISVSPAWYPAMVIRLCWHLSEITANKNRDSLKHKTVMSNYDNVTAPPPTVTM